MDCSRRLGKRASTMGLITSHCQSLVLMNANFISHTILAGIKQQESVKIYIVLKSRLAITPHSN